VGGGGFGAGAGGSGDGGGGLGAGGAAFVRRGGSLTLIDPVFTGTVSATGGAAGGGTAGSGQGVGQGLFLGGNLTLQVSSGKTITLSGTDFLGGGFDTQAQGGLTKAGPGTLTLAGPNSYVGGTSVTGGTLLVTNTTGAATGTGLVTVGTGAANSGTLGGTGAVGVVTIAGGGTVAPGNGAASGKLTFQGGLTLQAGSAFDVVTGNGSASSVAVFGPLDVTGGTRTLAILDDGSLVPGKPYTYTIATMSTTFGFSPSSFSVTAGNFGGFLGTPTVTNPGGNSLVLSFTPVPEPAAALAACALVAAGWAGFWRRRWASNCLLGGPRSLTGGFQR
jgi:hypothetical protein